jgi:hypothetical protein
MGSPLAALLVLKRLLDLHKPKQEFSSRRERLAVAVAKELAAAPAGLILVLSFVAFFYLYCVPWLGVH